MYSFCCSLYYIIPKSQMIKIYDWWRQKVCKVTYCVQKCKRKKKTILACFAGTVSSLSFYQNTKDKNERSSNIGQPSAGKQHYGHVEIFHIKGRDQGRRAACGSSLWSRFSCTLAVW
jgi:hypothetical protein